MKPYKAGTCTVEQVREYLGKINPDLRLKHLITFKNMICAHLEGGDAIYISEEEIRHFKHDNSSRIND